MDRIELDRLSAGAMFKADEVMDEDDCKRGLPLATSFIGRDEEIEYLRGIVEILKWEMNDVFDAFERARSDAATWRALASEQAEQLDRLEHGRDHQRAALARLRSEGLARNRAMP